MVDMVVMYPPLALGEEAMALGWRRALVLTTTGRFKKKENAT